MNFEKWRRKGISLHIHPGCNVFFLSPSYKVFQLADDFYLNKCRIVDFERKLYEMESWLTPNLHLEY